MFLGYAGVLAPASPHPYRGFTTGRAEFIDQFHDAANKLVLPNVEYVAKHAHARYPLMLH
jgi:hypothetical protein